MSLWDRQQKQSSKLRYFYANVYLYNQRNSLLAYFCIFYSLPRKCLCCGSKALQHFSTYSMPRNPCSINNFFSITMSSQRSLPDRRRKKPMLRSMNMACDWARNYGHQAVLATQPLTIVGFDLPPCICVLECIASVIYSLNYCYFFACLDHRAYKGYRYIFLMGTFSISFKISTSMVSRLRGPSQNPGHQPQPSRLLSATTAPPSIRSVKPPISNSSIL